jgi:hypothetical protein
MKVRFSATAIFGFHEKISLNEVSVIKKIVVDNSILIIIKKKGKAAAERSADAG